MDFHSLPAPSKKLSNLPNPSNAVLPPTNCTAPMQHPITLEMSSSMQHAQDSSQCHQEQQSTAGNCHHCAHLPGKAWDGTEAGIAPTLFHHDLSVPLSPHRLVVPPECAE